MRNDVLSTSAGNHDRHMSFNKKFPKKIFGIGLTGTGTPQLKSALIAIGLSDVVLADQTLVPYLFDDVSTYNFTGLVMIILFH